MLAKHDPRFEIRVDWHEIKDGVMLDLIRQKFSDKHPELRDRLIATYPRRLSEGNKWGDRYWGVDLRTGIGEDRLGKILMRVRDEIMAPLCVSSPKDGSVHSCSALDCPVHGERNRTVPGFGPLPEEVEGVRLLKRKEGDPQ